MPDRGVIASLLPLRMHSIGVIASLCSLLGTEVVSSPRYVRLLLGPGIDTSRRSFFFLQWDDEAIRGGHKRAETGSPASEYRREGTILPQRKKEKDRGRAVQEQGRHIPTRVHLPTHPGTPTTHPGTPPRTLRTVKDAS